MVDQGLLRGPLAGLTLLDRRGRRLADPLAAGDTFLLGANDAKEFAKRVSQHGGTLDRVESWLPEIERHFAGVEECQRRISLNLQADMEAVDRIERGDLSEQLGFDARGAQTRELVGRARALLTRMDEDLAELERTSTATRARGIELRERAQSLSHEIEALGAARTRLEELAAQGALLAYDRNSYRGVDVNGSTAAAKERATDIAGRVFVANACGMIAAPFVQEVPVDCSDELPSGPRFVSVACADELNDASFSEAKCGTDQGSKATRVTVNAEALQPLWLVSADPSESGALSYRLTGRASAYSYSPSAEAEEE